MLMLIGALSISAAARCELGVAYHAGGLNRM